MKISAPHHHSQPHTLLLNYFVLLANITFFMSVFFGNMKFTIQSTFFLKISGCSSSPWFDGFGLQWWFDSHFEVNFVRCSPARFFHIFILKEALVIIVFVIMTLRKAQKWYIYAGYFTTSSWPQRSERFSLKWSKLH